MQRSPTYAKHASGLLVPYAIARAREVWTKDEARLLERAMKLLTARGVEVYFGCPDYACAKQPMERVQTPDGGLLLRCNHKDRVFTKAF